MSQPSDDIFGKFRSLQRICAESNARHALEEQQEGLQERLYHAASPEAKRAAQRELDGFLAAHPDIEVRPYRPPRKIDT